MSFSDTKFQKFSKYSVIALILHKHNTLIYSRCNDIGWKGIIILVLNEKK